MEKIVECVPNFSEGKRLRIVDQIASSIASVEGTFILDQQADPDHNRCVITYVGPPPAVGEAALRATRKATELIDLNRQRGVHPRLGATDVVPFIPIQNVTMQDCVRLARETGRRIALELDIPVYLYERAATRADRKNLADIRKGQFEGLGNSIATDPSRAPDFGKPRIHPTAGATVVGARGPLIAYNINLETADLALARKIAKAIRERDGGLPSVKALGLELRQRGMVQVSMNLLDYEAAPLYQVFEFVRHEAERHGVQINSSEIVGLAPQTAVDACLNHWLRLGDSCSDHVLENRLRTVMGQK